MLDGPSVIRDQTQTVVPFENEVASPTISRFSTPVPALTSTEALPWLAAGSSVFLSAYAGEAIAIKQTANSLFIVLFRTRGACGLFPSVGGGAVRTQLRQ